MNYKNAINYEKNPYLKEGVMSLEKEIYEKIAENEMYLNEINRRLQNVPEGTLAISTDKNGNTRYYQIMRSNTLPRSNKFSQHNTLPQSNILSNRDDDCENGTRKFAYISKKNNLHMAISLAEKQYYSSLKSEIENELSILKKFQKKYNSDEKYEVFNKLHPERKNLIEKYLESPSEKAEKWYKEPYEPNPFYPEKCIYETEKEEFVRSKSEALIANNLFRNSDYLYYKYECPLHLSNCRYETVYPDFTIINRATGKITYWEHCGMMDKKKYADDFVEKLKSYHKNGIDIGENLMLTFETEDVMLDLKIVKDIVKRLIEY